MALRLQRKTTPRRFIVKKIIDFVFATIVATTPVFAQQGENAPATGVEIGTLFGFSRLSAEGEGTTKNKNLSNGHSLSD